MVCRWPFPAYPLTASHSKAACCLIDCLLKGRCVPSAHTQSQAADLSVFATWTAQKSYSKLHSGRGRGCPKYPQRLIERCCFYVWQIAEYQLFPQLFCSAEEDRDHRQQIWGSMHCNKVSIRDEIFGIFARNSRIAAGILHPQQVWQKWMTSQDAGGQG